jgi:hypothetical protein
MIVYLLIYLFISLILFCFNSCFFTLNGQTTPPPDNSVVGSSGNEFEFKCKHLRVDAVEMGPKKSPVTPS